MDSESVYRAVRRYGWGALLLIPIGAALYYGAKSIIESAEVQRLVKEAYGTVKCTYVTKPETRTKDALLYILVSRLPNDDTGDQTDHIHRWLDKIFGSPNVTKYVQYGVDCYSLATPTSSQARTTLQNEGRERLRSINADLLLWGKVLSKDKSVEINFLPRVSRNDVELRDTYEIDGVRLSLSDKFSRDIAYVISNILVGLVWPPEYDKSSGSIYTYEPGFDYGFTPGWGYEFVPGVTYTYSPYYNNYDFSPDNKQPASSDAVRSAGGKIPDPGYTDYSIPDAGYTVYATGWYDVGYGNVELSVNLYDGIQRISKLDIMDTGQARCHIGFALGVLALHIGDTIQKYREDAVEHLGKTISATDCDEKWVLRTQSLQYFGDALSTLSRFEKAVPIYRQVLKDESFRKTQSVSWAVTQYNLGLALQTLGQRDRNLALLGEAVTAYKSALEVVELRGIQSQAKLIRSALNATEAAQARLLAKEPSKQQGKIPGPVQKSPHSPSEEQAVVAEAAFVTYDSHDIYGGDFQKNSNRSFEECVIACQSESRCKAYSYDKWNRACYLKDRLSALTLEPNSISGVRGGLQTAKSQSPISIESRRNKTFAGKRFFEEKQTRDFETCERLCVTEQQCISFSFVKSSRQCKMYASADKLISQEGVDSGVKRQIPR